MIFKRHLQNWIEWQSLMVATTLALCFSTKSFAAPAPPLTSAQISYVISTWGGSESIPANATQTSNFHGPSPFQVSVDTVGQPCTSSATFVGGTVEETNSFPLDDENNGYRIIFEVTLKSGFSSESSKFEVEVDRCDSSISYTDKINVKFDRKKPVVSFTSPPPGVVYHTSLSSIDISGSATDNDEVTEVTWYGKVNDGTAEFSNGNWSVSGVSLNLGSNTITVKAVDPSGNVGTTELLVNLDTESPSLEITFPTTQETYFTRERTFRLNGSANDNSSLKKIIWEAFSTSRYQTNNAVGTTQWSASNITLFEGINTIKVTAYDKASNSSSDQITVTYAPLVPLVDYQFSEGFGSTATDSSGSQNNGFISGGSWTSFGSSSALKLNGLNDHIFVTGLMGAPKNITVAAWVNLSTPDLRGADVISLGDHVGLRLDSSSGFGVSGFYYDGQGWLRTAGATPFAGTGWHHFAYVIDTSNKTQKVFVDGIERAVTNHATPISYNGLGQNTYVGRHGNGSSNYDLNGMIDDVRIYNGAMTNSEISDLVLAKGLVSHWAFDDGLGDRLQDKTANGFHGTVYGAEWSEGKSSGALSFDGISDFVELLNPQALQPAQFTLSAWVKTDSENGMVFRKRLYGYGLELKAGKPLFWIYDSAARKYTASGPVAINDNLWHHVVGVFDGTRLLLSVDGILVGSRYGVLPIYYGSGSIAMGRDGDANINFFKGLIDEVRFYDRPFNKQEVINLGNELVQGQ